MSSKYTSLLVGTNVLVLGGSSGIGFCVAEQALSQGASVVISSSQQSKVDAAVQRLQESIPDAARRVRGLVCVLGDVTATQSNLNTLLESVTQTQKLDHIIITAGVGHARKPLADHSLDELQTVGNVRFFGSMILGSLASKYMKVATTSSLTFTTGTMTARPHKDWVLTAAYSSGVEGLMRGLSVELAPIRVNVVSPGAVLTELFDGYPKDKMPALMQMYREASLTGSVATPEDLSEAFLYLMRCSFVTGTALQVDGGRLMK